VNDKEEKRQFWMTRAMTIGWTVIVAVISTYITIRVTISEIQVQLKDTRELVAQVSLREDRVELLVNQLDKSQSGDTARQEEIYRRLDKIDRSQERIMELLSKMMVAQKR
jgi:hypothetical protein